MQIEFYAIRNKENGCFYKFREFCDDGYGVYEPTVSEPSPDDLPTFFNEPKFPVYTLRPAKFRYGTNEVAKTEDVEFVKFNIGWEKV